MFLEMAINFCILFTFSVLSYWPFQNRVRFHFPFPSIHPFLIGLISGITGLVLMGTGVTIADKVIVDGRSAVIVISGIFGGPIAPLISGLIIGVARIFLTGVTSSSVIAGVGTVIGGLVISLFSMKKRMTFRNAQFYFYYFTIQTVFVLAYLMEFSWTAATQIVYFIIFSFLSFFTVLFILRELSIHFTKVGLAEKLSETDFLTGLNNNRMFQKVTESITLNANTPFSLLLLDIDHFKKVNDTYGHPIGDEVLRELASRLRRVTHKYEGIVSRNGGEEFSVILQATEKDIGIEVAEMIRKAVESVLFQTSNGAELNITISVGLSTFPDNGNEMQKLYNQSDIALYHAKNTGRNKVVHIDEIVKTTLQSV
ncbi:diguanylate cyclase domain-containing protein [Lederbergia wuyishanensis]|uniref:Diguanylate cyclase n=1 Tax=Lederbergia wuyishanensis TaxID=1347903 RepID=A0ABU0D3G8_9BACI|nr:diguanylate cyclase [Lederbergia wuyishanensis]MCJ8007882.1 diguanylate cyclase [Lederbergia wuyishanensis]MDQ0342951.1 diguanylate cyclase [Lederbergia wuyishanensis]